jgi:ABC-2 type transport system permease protein
MTTQATSRRLGVSIPPLAGRRGTAALVAHQVRYEWRMFWRNRQSRFFTVALPILFLVIFASVWHGDRVDVKGGTIATSVYYVPGIITLGIVAAAFTNLVISVTASREAGIFKRRRATPVPAETLIVARALLAVLVSLGMTAVLLAIGWAAYGAHVPSRTGAALLLTVVVGAASFCCLGFALASVVGNEDAAQPITQAVILPLYFISGVFIPASTLPTWLTHVASVFPVRHLSSALLTAYNPHTTGAGVAWTDLLIVLAWGVGGLVFALRRFSWLPRGA